MNEQILREQIVELIKLLELKDMRIKELEALRTFPNIVAPWLTDSHLDKNTGLEQTITVTSTTGPLQKNLRGE